MAIRIEIDTHDKQLGNDLFPEAEFIGEGARHGLGEGVAVECTGLLVRKADGAFDTLHIVVTGLTGVSTGLLVNWLWSKIQGRARSLRIERTEVELEEGEITRVVVERIDDS